MLGLYLCFSNLIIWFENISLDVKYVVIGSYIYMVKFVWFLIFIGVVFLFFLKFIVIFVFLIKWRINFLMFSSLVRFEGDFIR